MWRRLGSPPFFYRLSSNFLPWLAGASILLLLTGSAWGLLFAPPDAVQGNSYRIIFVHVPASFIALFNYLVMAGAALLLLVWRVKLAEAVMFAAAPVGVAFSILALGSGAIWGHPTWGAWWVWDARVTSMLVLFFFYLGILALRRAYGPVPAAARACAVLALIGSVDVVIVYKSVDWWYSLHQPATLRLGEAAMHPSMLRPLLVMIAGFYGYYAATLLLWARNELLLRARGTRWAQSIAGG